MTIAFVDNLDGLRLLQQMREYAGFQTIFAREAKLGELPNLSSELLPSNFHKCWGHTKIKQLKHTTRGNWGGGNRTLSYVQNKHFEQWWLARL